MAVLFLLFSDFFMEGSYRLRMVHLSVNAVLVLAIFAHLFESFVWVMLLVCVFRRLFLVTLRSGTDDPMGSVWFSVHNHHLYIKQGLFDKVDNWTKG